MERKESRVKKEENARKWDSVERKTCGKGEFRIKIWNVRKCRKREETWVKCGKGDIVESGEILKK